MNAAAPWTVLDWWDITQTTGRLAAAVVADGRPDVVVGVLRGGMVPAVLLAHALGVRSVRAIEVTHTVTDGPDAAKSPAPTVCNAGSLGDLAGLDVLVVDDIAGTGDTIAVASKLVAGLGAVRVRTLVCVVNEVNWRRASAAAPAEALTYVGACSQGWVVFPWERQ